MEDQLLVGCRMLLSRMDGYIKQVCDRLPLIRQQAGQCTSRDNTKNFEKIAKITYTKISLQLRNFTNYFLISENFSCFGTSLYNRPKNGFNMGEGSVISF